MEFRQGQRPDLGCCHRPGMGFGISLHGSNLEPLMSALGQKQTYAAQKGMSALPLKADMCGAKSNVRYGPKTDNATKRNVPSAIKVFLMGPTRLTLNGRRYFRGRARRASCPIPNPPR